MKFYISNAISRWQISFFSMLAFFFVITNSSGQATYYVEGESLWRNQGYGVENHDFQISTRLTANSTTYPISPNPGTGTCGSEYYSTNSLTLWNVNLNLATVSLRNRPHSINNVADYVNGVNASDLVAIQAHILGTIPFSSRTPTDDEPYRKISADADYDHDIDANDVTMIQQLLLGIRSDLTRNSWEWVLKDWVEADPTGFGADPYSFVVDYLSFGGANGLVQGILTSNQILGDNDKYLTFRTTKIGDAIGTSGSGNNSWICGTGTYLTNVETRSINLLPTLILRNGSSFTIGVAMEDVVDLQSSQIPLFIDGNKVKLSAIRFYNNYSPEWFYNPENNRLMTCDFNMDLSSLEVLPGTIMEVDLIAISDIENLQNVVNWNSGKAVEFTDMDEEIVDPGLSLHFTNYIPSTFFASIIYGNDQPNLSIESPVDQSSVIRWITEQGVVMKEEKVNLRIGSNEFELEKDLVSGIYFVQVLTKSENLTLKAFFD